MHILIRERLKPFSHTPGAACLLPGTQWQVQAYPTLIRIGSDIKLSVGAVGPVEGFTLEQDLERNWVRVFGKARQGFYRLKIQARPEGVEVFVENAPEGFLVQGEFKKKKDCLFFSHPFEPCLPSSCERLSLGRSKSQDWDLVLRRFDLKEILPVLYGLAQKIPSEDSLPLSGTGALLASGEWDSFIRAGFSSILVPRLMDDSHQGFSFPETFSTNACFLIKEAFSRLRSLFFVQKGETILLLPDCPFDTGRLTGVRASGIGSFDLEWAAGRLRRAVLRSEASCEVMLRLPSGFTSFRLRSSERKESEKRTAERPMRIEFGKTYFMDRFFQ